MELREALLQISEIRAHMARGTIFRGYRAVTAGFTGLLALAVAAFQSTIVPDPAHQPGAYLLLWISSAALSILVVGIEMIIRYRRSNSILQREMTLMAVELFLPCLVAGGLMTYVLFEFAPAALHLLPGLWAILFSLGVVASSRVLPRLTFWVGAYYLLAGLVSLSLARGENAFSPIAMAVPFGGGQLLAAIVLYLKLERRDQKLSAPPEVPHV